MMMIITFLTLFHFIFSETIPIKADELADYINSKYMPNYYLLFDENNILSSEQKQTIESNLAAVFKESEYFIYCLVLQDTDTDNIKAFTRNIDNLLHHPFDYNEQRRLIYVLSIEKKGFAMMIGSQANKRIDNKKTKDIFSEGNPYYRQGDFGGGVSKVMSLVINILIKPDEDKMETFFPLSWMIIGCIIWGGLSLIPIIIYAKKLHYIKKEYFDKISYQDRKKMNMIMDLYDKIKKGTIQINDYCLICLNPIQLSSKQSSGKEENNDIQLIIKDPSLSVCDLNHSVHKSCLDKWHKASSRNVCPLCLEHVGKIKKEEIINVIMRIQGDINPIFRYVEINDKGKWGINSYDTNPKFKMHYAEYNEWYAIEMQRIREEEERRRREELNRRIREEKEMEERRIREKQEREERKRREEEYERWLEEDKRKHPEKYIKPKSPTPPKYSPPSRNSSPSRHSSPKYSSPSRHSSPKHSSPSRHSSPKYSSPSRHSSPHYSPQESSPVYGGYDDCGSDGGGAGGW